MHMMELLQALQYQIKSPHLNATMIQYTKQTKSVSLKDSPSDPFVSHMSDYLIITYFGT